MPKRAKSSPNLGWLAVLLAYVAVLAFFTFQGESGSGSPPQLSVWELQAARPSASLSGWLTQQGSRALLMMARFAPLGFFLALALPRGAGLLSRWFLIFLPASALSILLAAALRGLEFGPIWVAPGVLDLAIPSLGCLLGSWMGVSAGRGWASLLWFFPKLAILGLCLLGLSFALAYLATANEPLDIETAQVQSEHKRDLVGRLRRHNPVRLRQGQTRELELSVQDLDVILAWGLSVLGATPKAQVETSPNEALLRASAPLPLVDRHFNLIWGMRGGVKEGNLELRLSELTVGQLQAPGWLLSPASAFAETVVQNDRTLQPVLNGIDLLRFDEKGLTITYRRMEVRGDRLSGILSQLGPDEAVLEAARAQLQHLASVAPDLAGREDRFGACMQTTFALAKVRSESSDPVTENSGAILALANVLGHPQLRVFSGLESDRDTIAQARRELGKVTLRNRADWTKHFFVSAGLTQLSSSTISHDAGLLKEELDADMEGGGSGFSFADLLADRAGTLFAWAATHDSQRARAMQARLSQAFEVDQFFPHADGLAEGIPDEVLQGYYGGVGGAEYQRVIKTIERRLQSCTAYR